MVAGVPLTLFTPAALAPALVPGGGGTQPAFEGCMNLQQKPGLGWPALPEGRRRRRVTAVEGLAVPVREGLGPDRLMPGLLLVLPGA